jgi:hypothetical protein
MYQRLGTTISYLILPVRPKGAVSRIVKSTLELYLRKLRRYLLPLPSYCGGQRKSSPTQMPHQGFLRPLTERPAKPVKANYRSSVKLSKLQRKNRKTDIEGNERCREKAGSDVPGLCKFQIVGNIFFPRSSANEAEFTHDEIWQRSLIVLLM